GHRLVAQRPDVQQPGPKRGAGERRAASPCRRARGGRRPTRRAAVRAGRGGRAEEAAMSQGRYLYAVSRGLPPRDVAGVAGLGGAPLDVVEHRGLAVLVSSVDLEEYGEEGLRRNLEDLAWLEATARGHDEVVRFAAARGATAPMRLVTICLD